MSDLTLDLNKLDQRIEKLQRVRQFLTDPEVVAWVRESLETQFEPGAREREIRNVAVEPQTVDLPAIESEVSRAEPVRIVPESPVVWWREVA